jgi:hypothetical protein
MVAILSVQRSNWVTNSCGVSPKVPLDHSEVIKSYK